MKLDQIFERPMLNLVGEQDLTLWWSCLDFYGIIFLIGIKFGSITRPRFGIILLVNY